MHGGWDAAALGGQARFTAGRQVEARDLGHRLWLQRPQLDHRVGRELCGLVPQNEEEHSGILPGKGRHPAEELGARLVDHDQGRMAIDRHGAGRGVAAEIPDDHALPQRHPGQLGRQPRLSDTRRTVQERGATPALARLGQAPAQPGDLPVAAGQER